MDAPARLLQRLVLMSSLSSYQSKRDRDRPGKLFKARIAGKQ